MGWIGVPVFAMAGGAWAQMPAAMHAEPATAMSTSAAAELPDAPEMAMVQDAPQNGSMAKDIQNAQDAGIAPNNRPLLAPKYQYYINQGQSSRPLDSPDKIRLSLYEETDGFTAFTSLLAAGLSQWDNSDPKYGTDKGAFGERLGAAFIRQTSQAIFSDGLGATVFRDDPRYYVMGDGHSFGKRVLYAATRVVTTRSNTGLERPNAPLLFGYLAAAALTQAYYPPSSQNANAVFVTYGLSLAAAGLGYEFHEFLGDAERVLHLKRD
jgi:hypothetical protein